LYQVESKANGQSIRQMVSDHPALKKPAPHQASPTATALVLNEIIRQETLLVGR
jgi:hypothetical protein